ncbi:hypothetical protein CALCODRAFT_486418 [Calocera cornea HHB12733]|uniref:Uncharacterized protein n=1 Tax=Calocera cornea HHB12733 TaxID=1353952 RepID=A0A165DQW5_9BASI|nr:hypothetical protein CALCODRAFT_486418 [Calocera cornea HHB12733]
MADTGEVTVPDETGRFVYSVAIDVDGIRHLISDACNVIAHLVAALITGESAACAVNRGFIFYWIVTRVWPQTSIQSSLPMVYSTAWFQSVATGLSLKDKDRLHLTGCTTPGNWWKHASEKKACQQHHMKALQQLMEERVYVKLTALERLIAMKQRSATSAEKPGISRLGNCAETLFLKWLSTKLRNEASAKHLAACDIKIICLARLQAVSSFDIVRCDIATVTASDMRSRMANFVNGVATRRMVVPLCEYCELWTAANQTSTTNHNVIIPAEIYTTNGWQLMHQMTLKEHAAANDLAWPEDAAEEGDSGRGGAAEGEADV